MVAIRSPGLSGLAVALAAGGAVVAYSGIKNATVADTLRSLIQGAPVAGSSSGSLAQSQGSIGGQLDALGKAVDANSLQLGRTVGDTSGLGQSIVTAAQHYLGVRYVFGGADPSGFDCSGLVTWVLHHDLGINLPSNVHTVTGQFYIWSGATTVPRDQCAPGDLVCWTGHIGIAIDSVSMINAPHPGTVVQVGKIWSPPAPLIRRVNAPMLGKAIG